jgi:curved DNA-binding protein CbpA
VGPAMSVHDPYEVLGVGPNATRGELTSAYRRAVHRLHPDVRPDDTRAAAAEFAALREAYELLCDPNRRAAHDRAQRPVRIPVRHRVPAPAPSLVVGPVRWHGPTR